MTIQLADENLAELAVYFPERITPEILADLLAELQTYRNICEDVNHGNCETPEELAKYIEEIEELSAGCNNEDHKQFDDYKTFFDDCVSSLNAHLPCAAVYDTNLTQVIFDAISKGDVDEEVDQ